MFSQKCVVCAEEEEEIFENLEKTLTLPAHHFYEIAVLREAQGKASPAIHDNFQLGTRLNVDLPGNQFPLHKSEEPAVLVAGGIGITPIRAMAHALKKRGVSFQLHYAAKDAQSLSFQQELQTNFEEELHLHLSDRSSRLDVQQLLSSIAENAIVYVCGPTRLISAFVSEAERAGITANRIRYESFS